MHFSSQNLNEKPGKKLGSMWREGRCWLFFGERSNFQFSWVFFRHSSPTFGFEIGLGDYDDALKFQVDLWFMQLYFMLDHWKLEQWLKKKFKRKQEAYGNGRNIGIRFFSGILWFSLWEDHMEHRSSDPKWWAFNIHVEDILKGKTVYTTEILEEREVLIPMPEKTYKAIAKKTLSTWKRPRWFTKSHYGVDFEIPEGIPFEGKGENSWDCGTDATFGMSCGAKSIPEGVGKLVGSVLADRIKNGGWNDWTWNKPRTP